MINRKLKFLAIVLLSISIIIPAELSLVSSTTTGPIHINSTTTSTPGQQVILGSEVDLYLGNMSVSASMVHLVISQNPTIQFTAGDRIYSPSLATSFLWSSIGTTVTNTSNGWWTIQSNWINGTIPSDIPTGNYYIKLMDSDTGQIIAVTDTYITTVVSGYLQLYPPYGTGGANVQFTGSNFEPNQPVDIAYYDQTLKTWVYWETQTANASGVFVFNKEIPDLGASLSSGDNPETTKPLSFKAYGNGTLAFADYYQYLRGLKTVDDQTATGLFGNNTYLSQVQVKVGENVSILGKYFHPQDTIYIRWDDIQEVGTV